MSPVFLLVGQPNVGKSTLFNRFTRTRNALVHNEPGVTRDTQYGKGIHKDRKFLIVDSGGLAGEGDDFSDSIERQINFALLEATCVFFVVDSRAGLSVGDEEIAEKLRKSNCKVFVLVNKSEGRKYDFNRSEFMKLGFEHIFSVSATHNLGLNDLLDLALHSVQVDNAYSELSQNSVPKVALVGRPNIGKSTLLNRILGYDRSIVSNNPGTTRDSIEVDILHQGQKFTLIDTAGIRRRAKVDDVVEKFSVIKTFQAIDESNVVLLMLSAVDGVHGQDATIANMILTQGKSIVLLINKWDAVLEQRRIQVRDEIKEKLHFLPNPEVIPISALKGTAIHYILPAAKRAFLSATQEIATSHLNQTLSKAMKFKAPPIRYRRQIRPKFAHQAGKNPLTVRIIGNQVGFLPQSYQRYLVRFFSTTYQCAGSNVRLWFQNSDNPYQEERSHHDANRRSNSRKKKNSKAKSSKKTNR